MSKHFSSLVIVSILSILVIGGVLLAQVPRNAQASSHSIPGQYIVVLKDAVASPQGVASEMVKAKGLTVNAVYSSALKGFAASIPAAQLDNIARDPRVQFISEDREVSAVAQTTPIGISRIQAPLNTSNKGTGIGVAVIDTGIDLTHPDLKANIIANTSCIRGKKTGNDDNGHGSHVAGTIAALDNGVGVVGVAPQAKLAAVKVLNSAGSGTWSSVICGIDWVTANASTYNIQISKINLKRKTK